MKIILKPFIYSFLAYCLANSSQTFSAEFNYTLFSDLTYSDNIAGSMNGDSGTALTSGVSLNFATPFLDSWNFDLAGSLSHIEYSVDELSSEQRKSLISSAEYRPTTNNFSLLLMENVSQVPQNRFSNQETNNLRDVEITTVQPGYFIKLSPSNELNFEVTFIDLKNGNVDLTTNQVDGSRLTKQYTMGYERQINPVSFISLIGVRQDTFFEGDLVDGVVDFSQDDLFLRWVYDGASTQLQVDYGISKLSNELEQEVDTDIYSLSISRQLNLSHSLFLLSSQGFNNVLQTNVVLDSPVVNDDLSDFGTAIKIKDTVLNYTAVGTSFDTRVNITYKELAGTILRSAEVRRGFGLGVTYYVSRAFNTPLDSNFTFNYSHSKNSFDSNLSDVNETKVKLLSLTYNYSYSSTLSLFARVSKRTASQNSTENGNANTFTIGFAYNPVGRRFWN